MLDLTEIEIKFLRSQGFSASDVFDGRGLDSATRRSMAKAANKVLVLRDPSRSMCGHRLITRHGHCVQCDTSKISHQERYEQEDYVYIAGSKSGKILKIGIASDVERHHEKLNYDGYAGSSDWETLFHVKTRKSGRVEREVMRLLNTYNLSMPYKKDGRTQMANEIFRCKYVDVKNALAKSMQALKWTPTGKAWENRRSTNY